MVFVSIFCFWYLLVYCLFLVVYDVGFIVQRIIRATLATAGQRSATSLAMGPLNNVPLGLPLSSFSTMAALSSNCTRMPSRRRYGRRCRTMIAGTTFLRMSNFPFFTAPKMKSPTPAAGILPRTVLWPFTEVIFRTLAPELSQVSTYACDGSPLVTLALTAFMQWSSSFSFSSHRAQMQLPQEAVLLFREPE